MTAREKAGRIVNLAEAVIRLLLNYYEHLIARFRGTEHTFMVAMAVIIGLLGGYSAVAIQHLIHFFQRLFWGSDQLTLEYLNALPFYIKLGVPVGGSLLVGLISYFFAREARGHGVPEVMEAIALRGGKIRPRVVLAKLFSSSIYIGAGGSVGREGPVIQIGSAIGSAVGQFFKVNPKRLKTFVACGAASGIAAAFNAPVGGALFAVEVILGNFAVTQFSPIVISSVVATAVSRHYLGDHPAFPVPGYELVSPFELIPYAVLGLLAGLVSLLFIKILYASEDYFHKSPFHDLLKPLIGGLIIGGMGILVPAIYGVGYDSMYMALEGKIAWYIMAAYVLAKILATSVSLGSGGSGGVFAPALFLGTMLGGAFGAVVHIFFPGITAGSGAYSMVGMAAVVAGTMHAPMTAILIIFEITNDYTIILPLMVSSIIATILTMKLKKESIYTLALAKKGINLYAGRDINLLKGKKVRDIMGGGAGTIRYTDKLPVVMQKLMTEGHNDYFIVNKYGKLKGTLSLQDVKDFMDQRELLADIIIAGDIMRYDFDTVKPEDNLDYVMHLFARTDKRELAVVNNDKEKKFLGFIRIHELIDTYNKELFQRDLSGSMDSLASNMESGRTIEFIDQYRLMELPIPDEFVDQKIRNLDIRRNYDIEIILVRSKSQSGSSDRKAHFPKGDYAFQEGDEVLVLGEPENIDRFQKRNPRNSNYHSKAPAE
ncbi:MAG TPA: CBS domain-containing protein [Candidatus Marinimicrobia bacterium]|nr:CBS domain-containing protein [Candidatus Neomarinimicrobiota bacterium]